MQASAVINPLLNLFRQAETRTIIPLGNGKSIEVIDRTNGIAKAIFDSNDQSVSITIGKHFLKRKVLFAYIDDRSKHSVVPVTFNEGTLILSRDDQFVCIENVVPDKETKRYYVEPGKGGSRGDLALSYKPKPISSETAIQIIENSNLGDTLLKSTILYNRFGVGVYVDSNGGFTQNQLYFAKPDEERLNRIGYFPVTKDGGSICAIFGDGTISFFAPSRLRRTFPMINNEEALTIEAHPKEKI